MKMLKKLIILGAIIFFFGGTIHALEIEIKGGAGNMAFDDEAENALVTSGQDYVPRHFPVAQINIKGDYSELLDFSFRFERSPLLRSRALGLIGLNLKYGRFEIGPLIGIFNTKEQPLSAGISGGIVLQYPGIIFGALRASSTLASPLSISGDHIQSDGEAVIGFWVPNVICSTSVNIKNFTCLMSDELLTRDTHIRYQVSADVHSKNVPYTVRVDMGYQTLSRSYRSMGSTKTDELKSVYAGFEGTWRIIPSLRFILGLEMPLYSWTGAPLKKYDPKMVLYQVQTGVILTFR